MVFGETGIAAMAFLATGKGHYFHRILGSELRASYFVVAGRAKPYPKVVLVCQEYLFAESAECELHSFWDTEELLALLPIMLVVWRFQAAQSARQRSKRYPKRHRNETSKVAVSASGGERPIRGTCLPLFLRPPVAPLAPVPSA